jgi:Fic family protein
VNLYELSQSESNPVYQKLAASNHGRQYSFLSSMIEAAIESDKLWLSESLIKAFNYQAIVGLHYEAGEYRSVEVTVGSYNPPDSYRVKGLMEDFVNLINSHWRNVDSIPLSARALWEINHIHPFVNGNGRTARAVCYYILCVKLGRLLPGNTILPEMIRQEPTRTQYVQALKEADSGDFGPLVKVIGDALIKQITEVDPIPQPP